MRLFSTSRNPSLTGIDLVLRPCSPKSSELIGISLFSDDFDFGAEGRSGMFQSNNKQEAAVAGNVLAPYREGQLEIQHFSHPSSSYAKITC